MLPNTQPSLPNSSDPRKGLGQPVRCAQQFNNSISIDLLYFGRWWLMTDSFSRFQSSKMVLSPEEIDACIDLHLATTYAAEAQKVRDRELKAKLQESGTPFLRRLGVPDDGTLSQTGSLARINGSTPPGQGSSQSLSRASSEVTSTATAGRDSEAASSMTVGRRSSAASTTTAVGVARLPLPRRMLMSMVMSTCPLVPMATTRPPSPSANQCRAGWGWCPTGRRT